MMELMRLHKEGHRAAVIFCVQMGKVSSFSPAADIDPNYAENLANAVSEGVLALACRADVFPEGIFVNDRLEVKI